MLFNISKSECRNKVLEIVSEIRSMENVVDWNYPKTGLIVDRVGHLHEIVKVTKSNNAYIKSHMSFHPDLIKVRRVNSKFRGELYFYITREQAFYSVLRTHYRNHQNGLFGFTRGLYKLTVTPVTDNP